MNEYQRAEYRKTLIHEMGHLAIGHAFGVPILGLKLFWESRAQSDFALEETHAAFPYRPWCDIVGKIAVAGVVAEHMSAHAQTSADEIIADLSTKSRYGDDYDGALDVLPKPAKADDLCIFVDDVRGMMGPKIRKIVRMAHYLTERRMSDPRLFVWEIPLEILVAAVE
jgi:hypothetical protein